MNLKDYIEIVSASDVGRRYDHNEDSIATIPELGLAIVADGVGGHNAGEVASAIAVDRISGDLLNAIEGINVDEIDEEKGFTKVTTLVKNAIIAANDEVFTKAQQPKYNGMGSTVVMALLYNNQMTVAHVGDSRLYRFIDSEMEQITKDHTLLQELVDRGFYTPEEARDAPNKNIVTRALGADSSVDVAICEEPVLPGNKLLLCSDGLTDMLEDKEILEIMNKYTHDNRACCQALINEANQNGGIDNISVIIIEIKQSFASNKQV
jgi:protein phosphatase